MRLVWKLLRRHISLPQLAGFFLANLLGMLIVLLSLQFYRDVKPVFSAEDGFIRPDYLILSKRISVLNTIGLGSVSTFSQKELDELQAQPFTKRVGAFTASGYKVACSMGINGVARLGTEMFFESVPDAFVDVDLKKWHFREGDDVVPIILPRTYLAIYNFGFAQSQNLPKISEGIVGMVEMTISMRGNGRNEFIKGRVIGFSTRLNTILVPESFIRWSNERYAPEADAEPSRIILEVKNPADDAIVSYINEHGYELEDDKLDAGRMTFFLRLVSGIVMLVGLDCGQTEGSDREGKSACYKVVQELLDKSKEENGSLICAEILGLKGYEKAHSSYQASARTAEYYKSRPCAAKVESAARIFAEYLRKKANEA